MTKGKIIAAFGIPGSGKSSVTRAIGGKLGIRTFHEPEEESWAPAVQNRKISGNFTAIMWFRSIRIPMLYEASVLRDAGEISMIDSFYDKLFSLYITAPGIEWLFRADDPYFEEMELISKRDYSLLPEADVLIFLRVDAETWKSFITARNRNLDHDREFATHCFNSQDAFLNSARRYCKEKHCRLIVYDQHRDSAEKAADAIIKELREAGVLHG